MSKQKPNIIVILTFFLTWRIQMKKVTLKENVNETGKKSRYKANSLAIGNFVAAVYFYTRRTCHG